MDAPRKQDIKCQKLCPATRTEGASVFAWGGRWLLMGMELLFGGDENLLTLIVVMADCI